MMIFDADGAVLGRVGTTVAKALLKGEEVVVVNAEKIIISGDPIQTVERFKVRRALKNKANPEHAPHFPRRPDMLVRRIFRGMLPFYKQTGRDAYKRLKVYMEVPTEFEAQLAKAEKFEKKVPRKFITILQVSRELGWYGNKA